VDDCRAGIEQAPTCIGTVVVHVKLVDDDVHSWRNVRADALGRR
jgi:hypothetical protein